MSDLQKTIIEFCLERGQLANLSLVVPSAGAGELLAEALYRSELRTPGQAVCMIIHRMERVYGLTELVVGGRRDPKADIIVVDFISKLVSDRTEGKSYKFSKWIKRFQ
jgi:hypothetical protein